MFCVCCALVAMIGCAKKRPTSQPVVIEDVLPSGAPVCFPKGMTSESSEVGGAEVENPTTSPLKTRDTVPEVFIAPTTQPTQFSDRELGWLFEHRSDYSGKPISYSHSVPEQATTGRSELQP